MFVPTESTTLLAIVGMVGVFSTAIIMTYAFRRNRMGDGRY